MPLPMPILHTGGFSWAEALVLLVAILAVPAISWFTGRRGKRPVSQPERTHRRQTSDQDDVDVRAID